jgi:hypothetical protein
MENPSSFFQALEIIEDQKSLITVYKNRLRDSESDLEATRQWAISLDTRITEMANAEKTEINTLKAALRKCRTELLHAMTDIEEYKVAALQSAKTVLDNLEVWGLASFVSNMTGNQEVIDKGEDWMKKTLWKFLQVSQGRWPNANEYESNIEKLGKASHATLLEYMSMNTGTVIKTDELRKQALTHFLESYALPPWL